MNITSLNDINRLEELDRASLIRLKAIVERTLSHESFSVLTIHDSFGAHPNHMGIIQNEYRELMAEIAESDMIECIIEDICGERVVINKDKNLPADIRKGMYALS